MSKTGSIEWVKNNVVTSKVKVKWAFTAKPDSKFGPPQYKVEWWYDSSDPDQKAFAKDLLDIENAFLASKGKPARKTPSALRADKQNPKLRFWRASCKPKMHPVTGDRVPLNVVDSNNQPCDRIPVFKDDIVKVAMSYGGWESQFGCGVKLYLNGVQLFESNYDPGQASGGSPFAAEGGGFEGGDTYEDNTEPPGTEEPPAVEVDEGDLL